MLLFLLLFCACIFRHELMNKSGDKFVQVVSINLDVEHTSSRTIFLGNETLLFYNKASAAKIRRKKTTTKETNKTKQTNKKAQDKTKQTTPN